jgi:hypothetical protein
LRAVFLKMRDRDEWTALLAGENTCATPVLESRSDAQRTFRGARQLHSRRIIRCTGPFASSARAGRQSHAICRRTRSPPGSHRYRCRAGRGRLRCGGNRAPARLTVSSSEQQRRSGRRTPEDGARERRRCRPRCTRLIGVAAIRGGIEFPIEMGYVYNTCAAVQNGNPLYWDEGGRARDHAWLDHAADDDVGVVPAALLGAGGERRAQGAAGAFRPQATCSTCPRRSYRRQRNRFRRAGASIGDRLRAHQIVRSVSR